MWGLGITAIEMAETQPPRFNIHPMRVIFMVRRVAPAAGSHPFAPAGRRPASEPALPTLAPPPPAQQISKEAPPKLADAERWSMSMHDFVAAALVKDPKQRPTAAELLQQPFISSCKARGRARGAPARSAPAEGGSGELSGGPSPCCPQVGPEGIAVEIPAALQWLQDQRMLAEAGPSSVPSEGGTVVRPPAALGGVLRRPALPPPPSPPPPRACSAA